MARLPGRTRKTINWMAQKLGVVSGRSWSRNEVSLLKKHYPERGTAVADLLPGRTQDAVKIKACEMEILFRGCREGTQQMWNRAEWLRLEINAHLPLRELLKLFPYRTRSSVQHARGRLKEKKSEAGTLKNKDRAEQCRKQLKQNLSGMT